VSVTVGDVRVEVEKDQRSDGLHWRLVARWTPDGLAERQLTLGSSKSGWEVSYLQGAVDAMLRHAYEQGRIDASLGF
jgi:hypothetical protein